METSKDAFRCPVCSVIPEEQIFMCKKGHTICEGCSKKHHFCPTQKCGVTLGAEMVQNLTLEALVKNTITSCDYKESGCEERVSLRDLRGHLADCNFRPVQLCKLIGYPECTFSGCLEKDILKHLVRDHKIPLNETDCYKTNLGVQLMSMKSSNEDGGDNTTEDTSRYFCQVVVSTKFKFLEVAAINVSLGEYSIHYISFGEMGSSASSISAKITSGKDDFSLQWVGKPAHYRSLRNSLIKPSLRLPISYILDNMDAAKISTLEVSFPKSESASFYKGIAVGVVLTFGTLAIIAANTNFD